MVTNLKTLNLAVNPIKEKLFKDQTKLMLDEIKTFRFFNIFFNFLRNKRT